MIIEGMCEPDGPGTGYVMCEDAFATRWFVATPNGQIGFETRDLAKEYVAAQRRRNKFTWGPGDVEHG